MHRGADVTAGLLLDGRGDDGRMGNAGLVEAVRRRGHHVRGETAGHQAEKTKGGNILTDGFDGKFLKRPSKLGTLLPCLTPWVKTLYLLHLSRLKSYTQ